MRVSVSENFKIQRWFGFPFFQNSESSGGVGDEKTVLGKISAVALAVWLLLSMWVSIVEAHA